MKKNLLEGVKVIELATFIAAATAGRFMADLGADVIKVEAANGDPLRYTAASEGRPNIPNENTTWDLENANKRGISLNTKDPAGKEAFLKLVKSADILITNWRPQALERSGLDYENLKKVNPALVYGMCSGYGEKGPDKDLPGFDFTAFFARGGYLETLRPKGSQPMNVIPGLGDHNVGMALCAGLLAAFHSAQKTGQGELVTTSLFQTALYNISIAAQASQYTETFRRYPISMREAANPCNTCWKTKDDRYIQTVFPGYNVYSQRFLTAIGRPDLAQDEDYWKIENLVEKNLGTSLYDMVMEAMSKKTAAEWKVILTEADIPFSLAQSLEELLVDEQAWANECFYEMTYENGNKRTLVRPPVNFANMGTPEYKRGPRIGEHGAEVLKDIGYSDAEIKQMLENKAMFIS